ncbi:TPA: hypothetical protein ACH3X3_007427 [Trebouxia sp. C0006]
MQNRSSQLQHHPAAVDPSLIYQAGLQDFATRKAELQAVTCRHDTQIVTQGHASDKAASLSSCAGIAAAALCTSSE